MTELRSLAATVQGTHRLVVRFAALAAFIAAGSLANAEDADAVKAELKKIEGTWQLQSAISDGKATDAEVVKKIKIVIKDSKHTVHFGEQTLAKEIPFTIDLSTDPKSTEDQLPEGKTIKGIYKLEGDTLTSCVAGIGKDRPTEFVSKPGTGHTLRVFMRAK